MKIWVIEDEVKLAEFLTADLRREGYVVEVSSSLEALLAALRKPSFVPDILIMDRLLHHHDTLNHLAEIKETFVHARILILSAINTTIEKARALDRGADDYLGKPFSTIELLARIRVLSRRPMQSSVVTKLRCGNLVLDIEARLALVGDRKLNLPNKEFLLLRTLMQQPGKVFKKGALFEKVWEIQAGLETNVVEATVTNLRRKLEESQANLKIRNMRNAGYWLET